MDQATEFEMIVAAVEAAAPGAGARVTIDTDLVGDGVLDSLDVMSFLFELEQALGAKLDAVTEDYADYRVRSLVGLLVGH